jgi:hypothetical protein
MAQFDARKEGAVSPEFLRTSRVADPRTVTVISEQTLLSGQAAQFVFHAPGERSIRRSTSRTIAVRCLCGCGRPGALKAYVEQVVAVLAETAMRLWPVWFTDVSFAMCCDDALGRQAAGVIAREAAARAPDVSSHLGGSGGTPRAGREPAARSWRPARDRTGAAFTRRQPRRPRFRRRCERGGGCSERSRADTCAGMDRAALARRRGRPVRQGAAG